MSEEEDASVALSPEKLITKAQESHSRLPAKAQVLFGDTATPKETVSSVGAFAMYPTDRMDNSGEILIDDIVMPSSESSPSSPLDALPEDASGGGLIEAEIVEPGKLVDAVPMDAEEPKQQNKSMIFLGIMVAVAVLVLLVALLAQRGSPNEQPTKDTPTGNTAGDTNPTSADTSTEQSETTDTIPTNTTVMVQYIFIPDPPCDDYELGVLVECDQEGARLQILSDVESARFGEGLAFCAISDPLHFACVSSTTASEAVILFEEVSHACNATDFGFELRQVCANNDCQDVLSACVGGEKGTTTTTTTTTCERDFPACQYDGETECEVLGEGLAISVEPSATCESPITPGLCVR